MKNFILILVFISLILAPISLFAQEDSQEEAKKIAGEAIELMDEGEYDESRRLLEKCNKLDPENHIYSYEIALSYHLQSENQKAIEVLNKLLADFDSTGALVYQLLGSLHDIEGDPDKAIEIYKEGLALFPLAGGLYLELGVVEGLVKENLEKGLSIWEKGIEVAPAYPSNYYWASKVFCKATEEKVWGLIYGEIFMNLERNTNRTIEISKLLHDTYQENIEITSKKKMKVDFSSNQITISIEDTADLASGLIFPFNLIFEMTFSTSLAVYSTNHKLKKKQKLDAVAITELRTLFLDQWFDENKDANSGEKYPNVMLEWQNELKGLGYFEAYSMWLLLKGDEKVFDDWYEQNSESFDNFVNWFRENPMPVSQEFRFYRAQY